MKREIPLYTLEGVKDSDATTHWFTTADGLGLSLLRFCRKPAKDVVNMNVKRRLATDAGGVQPHRPRRRDHGPGAGGGRERHRSPTRPTTRW